VWRTPLHLIGVMCLGQVWLPLDLVDYEPQFQKAVARALGGYVIAASDEVAGKLAREHGIGCVTLDGKVSSRGSVSGGYDRGRGRLEVMMRNKIQMDGLQVSSMRSITLAGIQGRGPMFLVNPHCRMWGVQSIAQCAAEQRS
jgi:chromosome segregation ATPase